MKFETCVVDGPLSSVIETIFMFTDFEADYSVERIVPTGASHILIELDGITRYVLDDRTFARKQKFEGAWISGMRRRFLTVSVPPRSSMLVCQFKPLGAYALFHTHLASLNDTVTAAAHVFGEKLLRVREEVLRESDAQSGMKLVKSWLEERFAPEFLPPDDLLAVLEGLRSNPFSRHGEVISSYGKTQKHLISQFRKFGGLSPKVLHRIFRFNSILAAIRERRTINWSDVAFETGFADQSHFVRAFKEFSGINPTEFIDRGFNRQEPNFFPLDRG